jgi:hypothetical protein
MLQLYNNKYQHDLYITNYNGNNEYNKDYSIDKLDDSQWLVTLTFPNGLKQYELLLNKPRDWDINCSVYYQKNANGSYSNVQFIYSGGTERAPDWEMNKYYNLYDYTMELYDLTKKP